MYFGLADAQHSQNEKKKTFSWALVLLICYLVWFGLDFCDSLGGGGLDWRAAVWSNRRRFHFSFFAGHFSQSSAQG